jgi:hypothetical protein
MSAGAAEDHAAEADAENNTPPLGSRRACTGRHALPTSCHRLTLRQHASNQMRRRMRVLPIYQTPRRNRRMAALDLMETTEAQHLEGDRS